jgi:hypothetical protein
LRYYFRNLPKGIEENRKYLTQDSKYPDSEYNPGATEYETRMLNTQLGRSDLFDYVGPSTMAQVVMLLTRIRDMLGSNLFQDADYPD